MATGFLHKALKSVSILLLAMAAQMSLAVEGGQYKTADGMSVYVGVLPAEMLLGHPKGHHEREMHGGVPSGAKRHHVVVALFETVSGKRIADAKVEVGVSSIGMAASRTRAEPMLINGVTTYGAYVTLPSPGPYKIRVEIRRSEADKAVEVEFDYPLSRD